MLAVGVWTRLGPATQGAADPLVRTPDEPMYTAYAAVLAHEGLVRGTRISVGQYVQNPKIQIFPPPTRVGYLAPAAAWMRLRGRADLSAGIELSTAASLLAFLALVLGAWRYLGPRPAVLAGWLAAVSPLDLALSRKAWQDSLVALVSAAVLLCAFEVLRARRKWPWIAALAACGIWAVLVKESGAVYVPLVALAAAGALAVRGERAASAGVLGAAALAVVLALGILAWLSGDASALAEVYRAFGQSLPRNEYVLTHQGGPWWSLPAGMWLLSPVSLAACAAGLACGWRDSARRPQAVVAALVLVAFTAAVSWPAYFKNLRFLAPVLPAYFLTAGLGLHELLRALGRARPAAALLAALIAAGGLADAARFHRVFVEEKVKDPVLPLLERRSSYVPWSVR